METRTLLRQISGLPSYKSSYEEWKHIWLFGGNGAELSYKSSYEEWKQVNAEQVGCLLGGYKSSYEEWKRATIRKWIVQ